MKLLLLCVLLFALPLSLRAQSSAAPEPSQPLARGIVDNSFFIEEAFNQDPGMVQHTFTAFGSRNRVPGRDDRDWVLAFSQEWPIGGLRHQFGYTVPFQSSRTAEGKAEGLGDILLNYRYQVSEEGPRSVGFAPSLTLILPTGDEDRGLGDGTVGGAFNLPFSKVLGNRWTVHGNAGVSYLPGGEPNDRWNYSLGGSVIFAVTRDFNLMLESLFTWEEEARAGGNRTHPVSAILSPGMRYAWNFPAGRQLVGGLAAPIGLTREAPDFGVFFYLSFEHSFLRPAVQSK